ncbi:hypothetical protein [Hymenobacter sp. CRA2]|uniref:hypothetical protein n=1 Tax=Hymenobacter sp. CRA2 TaxID=1955620 RepID=UPI00098E9BD5|nr:hypothetical protein [Hymenobacter sp. CRA2]OON67061.1 hypothetical protein B0919_19710 [Hymenobacter sp. CRA2]
MSILASFPTLVLHLHSGPSPALETEWLGFTGSKDFRRYLTAALELARQHRVRGWIANDQLLGAVRPTDLRWVAEHVLPTLAELGVVRFARLEAQETLNRMLIGHMYQNVTPALPLQEQSFADLTSARTWATELASPFTA